MVQFKENHSGLQTKSAPVMVFLCGFPDKAESWSRLIPYFQENYHVITLNLPDFEKPQLKNTWGYNLITGNEVATALEKVIHPHTSKDKQIYLVGHDWGSVVCQNYISLFPGESNHIDKLVLLDVGKLACGEVVLPTIERLKQYSYVTWLAFCFCISKISSILSLLLISLYPWFFWGPCPYETDVPFKGITSLLNTDVKSHMTYPYFQFLVSLVQDHQYLYELITSYKSCTLPILFLYGERKAVKYHSQAFLDYLDSSKNKSKWKGYPNSGHWLHWTEAEKVAKDIQDFIEK